MTAHTNFPPELERQIEARWEWVNHEIARLEARIGLPFHSVRTLAWDLWCKVDGARIQTVYLGYSVPLP